MARSPTPTTRRDVTRRPSVGIVRPILSENIAKTTAARRRNATSMAYERPRTPATVGKSLGPYGMIVVRVHPPLWNRSDREDDGGQEEERDIDGVREAEDPGDGGEVVGAVRDDRRPRPPAALEPIRRD